LKHYPAKIGFHTVGIARGKDKEPLARQLGASVYIDSEAQDPAAELLKLGGAQVILAMATSGAAMSAVQGGVAVNGTLLIVGAAESMQVSPPNLAKVSVLSSRDQLDELPGPHSGRMRLPM
jgi:D-arabinose 1-dehydrogenase-like Zn-dependent alcohol dehydrogenase